MEKELRRKKRQIKKKNFLSNMKDIMAFRKRQFADKGEPKNSPFEPRKEYMPDKDPKETNHQRVVRQRLQSGRLGKDKNEDLNEETIDAEGSTGVGEDNIRPRA